MIQCRKYTPSASLLPLTNSLFSALLQIGPAGVEKQIHRLPPDIVLYVAGAVTVPTATVVEVRQIELVHALRFHEFQHEGQFFGIVFRVMENRIPTLIPCSRHKRIPAKELIVRTLFLAKMVVSIPGAIQADADVVIADFGDLIDVISG